MKKAIFNLVKFVGFTNINTVSHEFSIRYVTSNACRLYSKNANETPAQVLSLLTILILTFELFLSLISADDNFSMDDAINGWQCVLIKRSTSNHGTNHADNIL